MDNAFPASHGEKFEQALDLLAQKEVFRLEDRFRDGHVEAMFKENGADVSGSRLTGRAISEKDRLVLLGNLLAAAADRGLHPADVLAIGLAELLRD